MSKIAQSRTVSVSIRRPVDEVYAFASNPENLPKWASGLSESIKRSGDSWITETPNGTMRVRFVETNRFGVLDHYVTPPQGAEIYVPMRVVANGPGSEVSLTVYRQPEMSDKKFAEDAAWVERDLNALKALLEK